VKCRAMSEPGVVVFLLLSLRCAANWGDAFGLISRTQTFCELDSMTVASKLADSYNSLDESARKLDRMKHEYVMEHLGFGWEHSLVGRERDDEKRLSLLTVAQTTQTVRVVRVSPKLCKWLLISSCLQKGGWRATDMVALSYKVLENKWIYFYGDHSLRQITSAFLYPAHGTLNV
jgi:hypothetical protein